MASTRKKSPNTEIVRAVHAYSSEAYALAEAFVGGDASDALKQKARDFRTRLPEVAAQAARVSAARRPDLDLALSEARLDLDYVIAGGGRPSSMRLAQVIRERAG